MEQGEREIGRVDEVEDAEKRSGGGEHPKARRVVRIMDCGRKRDEVRRRRAGERESRLTVAVGIVESDDGDEGKGVGDDQVPIYSLPSGSHAAKRISEFLGEGGAVGRTSESGPSIFE